MNRLLIMLLVLAGVAMQAVPAEEQPADSSTTVTQPVAPADGQEAGSEPAGKAKEKGKAAGDEEPDCE